MDASHRCELSLYSVIQTLRRHDIGPDETHDVKQGKLEIWYVGHDIASWLIIGESATTPNAILMSAPYAYRNLATPQDIADDIYAHYQGDETVSLLSAMPNRESDELTIRAVMSTLGHRTSPRKAATSATNGRKGGRPKKQQAE